MQRPDNFFAKITEKIINVLYLLCTWHFPKLSLRPRKFSLPTEENKNKSQ